MSMRPSLAVLEAEDFDARDDPVLDDVMELAADTARRRASGRIRVGNPNFAVDRRGVAMRRSSVSTLAQLNATLVR